jgi:hypothetical protein
MNTFKTCTKQKYINKEGKSSYGKTTREKEKERKKEILMHDKKDITK